MFPYPEPYTLSEYTKLINEVQSISRLLYEVTATFGYSVFPEPTKRTGMPLTYFNFKQNLFSLEKVGNHPAGCPLLSRVSPSDETRSPLCPSQELL